MNDIAELGKATRFSGERAVIEGSKGGKMTAEKYKLRKSIRECLIQYLNEKISSGQRMTRLEAIVLKALTNTWTNPTLKDLELLQKILGEEVLNLNLNATGSVTMLPKDVVESIVKNQK